MMFELRVLDGRHQGAALPLFGEQWSIGAHADADLVLNDPGIAEQHARLRLVDSNWSVQAEAGLLQDDRWSGAGANCAPGAERNVFGGERAVVRHLGR